MGHDHSGWLQQVTTRPTIYNAYQRLVSADYRVIKQQLAAFVRPGVVHLDLGCGTGNMYPLVRARGGGYVGLDSDPRAIAYAQRRYPEADFRVGDATAFASHEGGSQRIFSVGLLHHLDDDEARSALRAIRRALAPDGTYLLIDAVPPASRWNALGRLLRRADDGAHVRDAKAYGRIVSADLTVLRSSLFGMFPLDYVAIEAVPPAR